MKFLFFLTHFYLVLDKEALLTIGELERELTSNFCNIYI
jgi:hypothetical protein